MLLLLNQQKSRALLLEFELEFTEYVLGLQKISGGALQFLF